jgi:MHS family alpha-ketoglutarate permease-like MFS transporter
MLFRRGMDESEQYLEEKRVAALDGGAKKAEGSLRTLLRYPRQLSIVLALAIGGTIGYYTYTTYMQKYMINTAGIDKHTVAWINFAALFIFMCIQPLYGALSDRIGRRKMMIFFGVTATIAAVPLLTLLGTTTNPFAAFGLMTLGLVIITPYSALSAIVKAELFPTKVRALGVGLAHAFAAAVFGGTAEPIALALKQAGHESVFFYYVAGAAALTLVASIAMKETRGNSTLDRPVQPVDRVTAKSDA